MAPVPLFGLGHVQTLGKMVYEGGSKVVNDKRNL